MKKGGSRRSVDDGALAQCSFVTGVLVVWLAAGLTPAGRAGADPITLIEQLDPFAGDDRYGDVWGQGNYAYIGSFQGSGVGIFDISVLGSAALVAHYNPASGGQFKDVKVQDGIGYFASDNGGGLHIVDLADPASPTLLSQITSADSGYDSIHNVFIDGDYLYEADSRTKRVKVFDVSDPTAPAFVRNIVTTDSRFIHDITVADGRLYTSGWGGTTDIYDITDVGTSAPALLGTVSTGSNSHSNWPTPNGQFLVSARELSDGDVRIYDISNLASPSLVASLTAASLGIEAFSPHNPIVMGDFLYISWYQAGLQVLDISDPANPLLVGSFDTFPGAVSGFDGNWGVYPFLGPDRVLLSDLDGGLFIVDAAPVGATLGDADLNGVVNLSDFNIWLENYGSGSLWIEANFTGDDIVNLADLNLWTANYGTAGGAGVASTSASAGTAARQAGLDVPAPEPSTRGLLAIGAVLLLAGAARQLARSRTRSAGPGQPGAEPAHK
ncbi:MAG: LVIVD repeat-containing protein, partial [Pirellulales bacterium]